MVVRICVCAAFMAVMIVIGCSGTKKSGSDSSTQPADIRSRSQITEDGRFRCMCTECFPACSLAEPEEDWDTWEFPEECPDAPDWHFEWCSKAECGLVDGQCMLIGPEPEVDRTADIVDGSGGRL